MKGGGVAGYPGGAGQPGGAGKTAGPWVLGSQGLQGTTQGSGGRIL